MRMMKVKLKLTHLKNMMRSLCSFMRIVVNFFLLLILFIISCEWDSFECSWCQVIQRESIPEGIFANQDFVLGVYLSLFKVFQPQLSAKTENKG